MINRIYHHTVEGTRESRISLDHTVHGEGHLNIDGVRSKYRTSRCAHRTRNVSIVVARKPSGVTRLQRTTCTQLWKEAKMKVAIYAARLQNVRDYLAEIS